VLLDTTFLIDLSTEIEDRTQGPAGTWLARNRNRALWTTVISLGEIEPGLRDNEAARRFLSHYRIVRLTPEVALEAASVDRELIQSGGRLGENDTWIAGFARYFGQPIVSNDRAFDRVRGIRRISY
jgi:predicted nucleic acid-binding protein